MATGAAVGEAGTAAGTEIDTRVAHESPGTEAPPAEGIVRVVVDADPAQLPRYASAEAAGADLRAAVKESITLRPGERAVVPTGVRCAIPRGYEGQVRPRSGLAARHGVTLVNSPGTIDSDYRGEIGVILINHGRESFEVLPGERLAQLVIAPVVRAEFVVGTPEHSDRGAGGFGSTGRS